MARDNNVRTPRKEKVWASEEEQSAPLIMVPNSIQVLRDLLAAYKLDVGALRTRGVTVMRIWGQLILGNATAESVAGIHSVVWGIAWVRSNVANNPAGDSNIPDPAKTGALDAQWIQRGKLITQSTVGTDAFRIGDNWNGVNLDITQMRKQPTVDHDLVLIGKTQSAGGGVFAPTLYLSLHTMLALP